MKSVSDNCTSACPRPLAAVVQIKQGVNNGTAMMWSTWLQYVNRPARLVAGSASGNHTLRQYRRELTPFSIRYTIPTKEAGDAPVTPPESRVPMGGDDYYKMIEQFTCRLYAAAVSLLLGRIGRWSGREIHSLEKRALLLAR
ncbi:hypothetical protein EVAR_16969_1 [Eumeta japonica]|uniref:Uncharacterized protein n=1 Tax=Eumeta variegata TaxID=151549 RepID=A0A4C1TVF0_EUMVA|nr:hypothetical protein EVAR_16969_1 [Eumeta japonica]